MSARIAVGNQSLTILSFRIFQTVFDELLRNDEDMLKMFLTEKKKRGGLLPDSHEECELLFESFHREISQLKSGTSSHGLSQL